MCHVCIFVFSGIKRTAGGNRFVCSSATKPAKAEYCNLFFWWEHHLVDIYTDERKVNNDLFCKDGFLRVWMLCIRRCWDQVLFLKKKEVFFFYIFLSTGIVCNLSIIRHTSVTCCITTYFLLFLKSKIKQVAFTSAHPHADLSSHFVLGASLGSKPEGR